MARGARWLEELRRGDRVFFASASGEPGAAIRQFVAAARAGTLPELSAYQMVRGGALGLLEAASERTHLVGLTAGELGQAARRGHAHFLPLSIFQLARALDEGRIRFDVAVIHVTPPDADGNVSVGISVDFVAQACRSSRLVVAQVNERLPRTLGDSFLHVSQLNAIVESSDPIVELPPFRIDPEAVRIAAHVASLVPDRATIEIGVGAIMTAVLQALAARSDLGLHTGLMIDPMVPLIEAGTITNAYKGIDEGVSVANQARGTRYLYDFLNENPRVSMRPARYTHDPAVVTRLRTFRAINSALQVDLLGQVNSEFVDGQRVSSAGGVADFVRPIAAMDGARSIVALRSTASKGTVSRIVRRIPADAGVTMTADLADLIVTENGIADLRGRDDGERAKAMIAIAAPEFRQELSRTS